jgi:hypothetical protein
MSDPFGELNRKCAKLQLLCIQRDAEIRRKDAEIARLQAFIKLLDGKTVCIRSSDDTFIDVGYIVSADVLGDDEQRDL